MTERERDPLTTWLEAFLSDPSRLAKAAREEGCTEDQLRDALDVLLVFFSVAETGPPQEDD